MNAMFERRKGEDIVRSNVKPQSNADRIRSMNDEELAELLAKFTTICEMCIHLNENCITMADARCREGILQWLKSEVKE